MSKSCIKCVERERTGPDLLCDECRASGSSPAPGPACGLGEACPWLKETLRLREALQEAMVAASLRAGATWPDIGPDPLKYNNQVAGGIEGAKVRLNNAVGLQQPNVPDQTMLAWRIDVMRVLDELTLMTARWNNLKQYLPQNEQAHAQPLPR